MTPVTLVRDKYIHGWPRHPKGERAYVLDLGVALEREYSSDAHFAAYRTPNGRRLVREAIDQLGAVELTAVVFDVDGPGHVATHAWCREIREKVQVLAAAHPGPYYYETRGGARIVYRQDEPTVLRSQDDALEWSRTYAIAVAYLSRRFGIEADPACNDWQRLYRLPRATRDAGGSRENHPSWGNAHEIGALAIEAAHEDLERAKRVASRPFRERKNDYVPALGSGEGLLFHVLRSRGWLGREAPRGGWICLCPNRGEHTKNSDWTDSTVLYPPAAGEQIGVIVCQHGHCEHIPVRRWLGFFSDSELEAARLAAGITRAA